MPVAEALLHMHANDAVHTRVAARNVFLDVPDVAAGGGSDDPVVGKLEAEVTVRLGTLWYVVHLEALMRGCAHA